MSKKKFRRPKDTTSPFTYLEIIDSMDDDKPMKERAILSVVDGPWGGASISLGESNVCNSSLMNLSARDTKLLRNALNDLIDDLGI